MALEPQPHPGALAGTAAGPAGRAVQTPYAAAAALSDAPGIGANSRRRSARRGVPCAAKAGIAIGFTQPNDPAAWGYAARSPMAGKNLEDHPALATRYVRRKAPFQRARIAPANSPRAR
jgi:hypothetical protein